MAIPDYDFYTNTYGGAKIKEADWKNVSARANAYIIRIENVLIVTYFDETDGRSMAICAVAEEFAATDAVTKQQSVAGVAVAGTLKSISTGEVSASFDSVPAVDITSTAETRYYSAMLLYAHIYHGGRWLQ